MKKKIHIEHEILMNKFHLCIVNVANFKFISCNLINKHNFHLEKDRQVIVKYNM